MESKVKKNILELIEEGESEKLGHFVPFFRFKRAIKCAVVRN